ncbi:TetR/AcrR family transcriptional regulator [Ideonella sp. 4Y16]|uniref:TetR/AcrR family transcriptional regulator n=1 Tax=Ideonella alba TaxID=2824118 RepID=A0A940YFQ8_9BURK|nr:TetR/AcrR family transcriptional regulator [Ideonella alba]MBQ0933338.1 TetR/AcrR family transcriptional regulator [Ideonella alba]MBQ0943939.1 TetR/AcrR family transcriptional regulator [Ideonella alba]
MVKLSFKTQVLQVREQAILDAVVHLLAEKGYELMTLDEVAAEVGIAKASLYKHFDSKEALAAAAMVQLLDACHAELQRLQAQPGARAIDRLQGVVRWALHTQLAGKMPTLPAQNSALRSALVADRRYMTRLDEVSEHLGAWIVEAQRTGDLDPGLPVELVLFTLFARACDPVLGVMRATGRYADETLVEWLLRTCFHGLAATVAEPSPVQP